jgi:hypothetical protein
MEQQQSKWACTWSNSRAIGLAQEATAKPIGLLIKQPQNRPDPEKYRLGLAELLAGVFHWLVCASQ